MPRQQRMVGRGGAGIMLALVTLFILYGSFFPFQLRAVPPGSDALQHLLATWRSWDKRGDLIANILFYIPFGLFLAALVPRFGAILAMLGGATLSFAVEFGQFHLAGRDSTLGDAYANTIGALLGGLLAMVAPSRSLATVAPAPALLLTMWLAYRLYPYLPVIDLHKYAGALRAAQGPLVPATLARYTVDWLTVAWLAAAGFAHPRRALLVLMAAAWIGQIIIIGRVLSPADLTGGVIALLFLLARRGGPSTLPLTLALAATIVAARLDPFTPAPTPRAFNWNMFSSLILGSPGIAVQAFSQKLFAYGSLILLTARTGLGLLRATLATAVLLFALSIAQLWLPTRSAEITDALMALIIGLTFHILERSAATHGPRKS